MDDEAIKGIAHTYASSLGIVDDTLAHIEVAKFIEVSMHHTSSCLDDRHLGIVAHKVNQFATASGNAHIDVSYGIEHLSRSLMCGFQKGDHIRIDTICLQHLMDNLHLGTITVVGILASLKHTRIAALEAKREDIECDIGTSLVNHTNNTKRYAHSLESQSIGECTLLKNTT